MREFINIIENTNTKHVYYHGTSDELIAKKIMKEGLVPQSHEDMNRSGKGALDPVNNRVYVTPSLRYAIIYALGGNVLGTSVPEQWITQSRYGYLFKMELNDISMLEPDEDDIGHAIRSANTAMIKKYKVISIPDNAIFEKNLSEDNTMARYLLSLAKQYLTPTQQDKLFNDFQYNIVAIAGKKILKYIPHNIKQDIVKMGCHAASSSAIVPSEVWKIDKTKSKELLYRGENFFQLATKVI